MAVTFSPNLFCRSSLNFHPQAVAVLPRATVSSSFLARATIGHRPSAHVASLSCFCRLSLLLRSSPLQKSLSLDQHLAASVDNPSSADPRSPLLSCRRLPPLVLFELFARLLGLSLFRVDPECLD